MMKKEITTKRRMIPVRKTMRILSLLLALLLVVTLLPAGSFAADGQADETAEVPYVFTEEDNALVDNDVFAMITDVEDEEIHTTRGNPPTPDDYAAILPQVIEAVEASDTYVEGSLHQNGSFLWWDTTIGFPCCYDPYMEAVDHGWSDPEREAGEEELAALEVLQEQTESRPTVRTATSSVREIGLLQPYWDNNDSPAGYTDSKFCKYSPEYKSMWEQLNEATGGTGAYRFTLNDVTVDHIAKCLTDCALVIVDGHGTTDWNAAGHAYDPDHANTSYICIPTSSGITSADTAVVTGTHGEYHHALLRSGGAAYVDGTCIANHMTRNAPNSLFYMVLCYSMATPGLCQPLRSKGVEVVYGYSRAVSFAGELVYMQTILGDIKDGKPFAEALADAKQEHGNWDPLYSEWTIEKVREKGKSFPIAVSSQDVYPGQNNVQNLQTVNSTWKLVDASPALTGTVSIIPAIVWYGDEMWYVLEGEAYSLQQSGVPFTVVWERSDDGETGWTAFTGGPHTANLNDINKYLRARVSATGYAGYLYSSPVRVTKAATTASVVKPQLWGSGTQVTVTNSQSNQEYFVLNYKKDVASLTESDWAAAKPGNGGNLTLNGTANSVNYVYTRLKETDTHFAGTVVVTSNIYLGEGDSLCGISLSYQLLDSNGNPKNMELDDMGLYYYAKEGDVIKITADPVPSNVTFNGVRGDNWLVNSSSSNTTYGRYYITPGCNEPIHTDTYYKTVYFKATKQVNHLLLSAQYYYGYNSLAYDSFSLDVADSSGAYLFDSATASITVYVGGTVKDYPIKRIPDRANLTGATISYRDGTGTNRPTVTLNGNAVSVNAKNATGGYYNYDLYKNGTKLPGGITVHVTTPPVEEFSISPTKLTVHPGKSYTLTPKFLPAASETAITWTSSNTNVATVNKGVVTVRYYADIGETATITATAGGKTASCQLTVFGQKFDLEIDGVQVTTKNLDDILGNGVFSFDGRDTLTVSGSYTTAKRLIYNYGVDNFTIYVKGNSTLTCTGSGTDAISVQPDTTITGSGKLTVNATSGCGIYAASNATTLTIENTTLVVNGRWGVAGPNGNNLAALLIRHANVNATGSDGAICDFGGGITIRSGRIVTPTGGKISANGREIVDSSGTVASKVVIQALENPFVDVTEDDYYFDAVLWAYYHDPQITSGTSETTFSPNATCTRAQVVTFLWRAAGQPEPTMTGNPFKDVSSGAYYYKAVLWAVEKGVTEGTSKTTFSPNNGCTRAQVVTFLWRAEGKPQPTSSSNPFTDVTGGYYYDAVLWAVENNITSGTSTTKFSPNATCTRGQVVTFLYRDLAG